MPLVQQGITVRGTPVGSVEFVQANLQHIRRSLGHGHGAHSSIWSSAKPKGRNQALDSTPALKPFCRFAAGAPATGGGAVGGGSVFENPPVA